MRQRSIGVFSVATSIYLDYWMDLALSADRDLFPEHDVVMTVFTDRVRDAQEFSVRLSRIRVVPIPVATLGWPSATLDKFRLVTEHADLFTQDLLMHLDADTLVRRVTDLIPAPECWHGGLALVRHPGFRRPPVMKRLGLYLAHPGFALRDTYRALVFGGLGTWEENEDSTAFVPRSLRNVYVCGGTWFGLREPFLEMCRVLSQRVDDDASHEVVAIFHDESHLNWYAANHQCTILDSDYCHAAGFVNLADLEPKISALEKRDARIR